MKQYITILFVVFFVSGLLHDPVFVMAGETCYVDEDSEDGDGSKDEPFEDIEEALDEDCSYIIVYEGTYNDDIIVSRSTIVEGKSKDDVIIAGKVTMKDGSTLKELTVDGRGVDIAEDADAKIKDVKIKNASTGIETTGGGKLTVEDVLIYGNGKGMYLQAGKNVEITDSEVRDNDEEGIDIRANVDGEISSNSINSNGESGIEVILGKSELLISDNSIKKNGSSGIAAQYYTSSSKLGAVQIKNNTISGNKDYGINCKAPSGGNPGKDYWSASTNMSSNKVYSNKDGEFSEACYFSDEIVAGATQTKKQKEEAMRLAQEATAQEQEQKEQENQKKTHEQEVKDLEEKERIKKEQQEQERVALQKEKNLHILINDHFIALEEVNNANAIEWNKVEKRLSIISFIIGPKYKEVKKLEETIPAYEEGIAEVRSIRNEMTDDAIIKSVDKKIQEMETAQLRLQKFVENQKSEFSLFGWIFNREK